MAHVSGVEAQSMHKVPVTDATNTRWCIASSGIFIRT